jgi:pSer/pThr/pTyr-binding forkhead associated (FHA) protein
MTDRREQIAVTYMSGPLDGKTLHWELPPDAEEMVVNIGRREGSDILLDYDSQVSRVHARVVYHAASDSFFLEDAGSRNGTFIGQQKLREKERAALKPGELFRVGRTWLRVEPLEDDSLLSDDDLPF